MIQTLKYYASILGEYLHWLVISLLAFLTPVQWFLFAVQLMALVEALSWEFARKKLKSSSPRINLWVKLGLYVIAILVATVLQIAFKNQLVPYTNLLSIAICIKEGRNINRNFKAIFGYDLLSEIRKLIPKKKEDNG